MNTGGPKLLHTLNGHDSTVRTLLLHPSDQKLLVSSSYDGSIRVWNIESGAHILTCKPEDGDEIIRSVTDTKGNVRIFKESVYAMIATLDGRFISGGTSGYVRVWNSGTG